MLKQVPEEDTFSCKMYVPAFEITPQAVSKCAGVAALMLPSNLVVTVGVDNTRGREVARSVQTQIIMVDKATNEDAESQKVKKSAVLLSENSGPFVCRDFNSPSPHSRK